jgi:hypothetical protein
MKSRAGALFLVTTVLLAGCSSGKVDLSYRFDENLRGTRYLWTINSTTAIDSSTDHSTDKLEMVIDVLEKVERADPNADPVLTVTLTPKLIRQSDSPVRSPGKTVVKYQLDRNGHIVEPLTSDLASQTASALELGTILSQSRVALPPGAVGIGDTWDAPLKLDGDTGAIDLKGTGRLLGFELNGHRKLARIGTDRRGDITAIEQLAGVLVQLRGKTTSNSTSTLDIDRGTLYSSVARFSSDFDMALEDTGKLAGTMKVDLTSKLEYQPV